MLRPLLLASCLNAPLAGTALAQSTGAELGDALTQPLRDLNILRREAPEVLQRAGEAPYADAPTLENGALDCASVADEVELLDIALGRDVSGVTPPPSLMVEARMEASSAIVDAVGDVVELPYRSLIRRLTGAHRRDREMRQAIQAGVVRRAYLRGLSARECAEPQLMAAFEPEPEAPLSDLDLARMQLAAANAAAAERVSASEPRHVSPPDDVMVIAAVAVRFDPEPAPAASETRLSDLELARMQLAAANAAAAAASELRAPLVESTPSDGAERLSDLDLARRQLAMANAAAPAASP